MGYRILKADTKRGILSEGRSWGYGFSILKLNPNNELKEVLPFTACKDYLNDVIHIEKYNAVKGLVHGLNYEPNNYFENDSEYGYLGVTALNESGQPKGTIDKELKNILKENIENIINVLNYFEKRLNIKLTELIYADEKYVFKVDRYWLNETFLISLYTLLIRYYGNFNKKVNVIQLLKHKPYIKDDEYLFNNQIKDLLFKDINNLKVYKKTNYKYPENATIYMIHNFGIKSYITNENNNKRKL